MDRVRPDLCRVYQKRIWCSTQPRYMQFYCAETCGMCRKLGLGECVHHVGAPKPITPCAPSKPDLLVVTFERLQERKRVDEQRRQEERRRVDKERADRERARGGGQQREEAERRREEAQRREQERQREEEARREQERQEEERKKEEDALREMLEREKEMLSCSTDIKEEDCASEIEVNFMRRIAMNLNSNNSFLWCCR